ncbi:MAG: hypothetical protein H6Q10_1230 [Acidobacteria bacterium]|nr:hypothetical protein [Acidobacteriota bacterium]
MLAVLHVAHSRHSSEGKIERLRLEPDLRVRLVRPRNRRTGAGAGRGGGSLPPGSPGSLDDTLRRPVWNRPDPHRCLYATLTFGLLRFRPVIVHVEEEPDSLAALQVCLARRACAPSARLAFHTWQNVRRPLGPLVRAILAVTLRSADAILCASPEAEGVVRSRGFNGLTRTILPQGVDLGRFVPPPARQPSTRFSVGYVGRLAPEKGCATLVEAFAGLEGACSLTLVGDGPERRELEGLAARLGAAERVRFAGALDHAAIPSAMAGLDVLVLPSRTTPVWKEQFGRVLAEAMACEVTVVGSDSGAIPGVIGDAGLVFPEGDAGALAARLRELRDKPGLRRALARRGRERAPLFSNTRLAEQTAGFYRELAGAGRASSAPRAPSAPAPPARLEGTP